MSISYRVLGAPDKDNALLVLINTGQSIERLLFDCGDECVNSLPYAEVKAVDHLFFSHLHMDHVGGFDSFFRANFNRENKPNHIWGPPETIRIMQHRFQGFLWNLQNQFSAQWHVTDIHPQVVSRARFDSSEGFSHRYDEGTHPYQNIILEGSGFTVEVLTMDHHTPSLAYIVRDRPKKNIDKAALAKLGLTPGPWIKSLIESEAADETLNLAGVVYNVTELRDQLIVESKGGSIAYLSDFLLDEAAMDRLVPALQDCPVVICESQYRHGDLELAHHHYHMTPVQAATLAKRANVGRLILFHVSNRYVHQDLIEMLAEARAIFPNTHYPAHWNLA